MTGHARGQVRPRTNPHGEVHDDAPLTRVWPSMTARTTVAYDRP